MCGTSGFRHFVCFHGSVILWHVWMLHSFLLSNNISLYEYAFYLPILHKHFGSLTGLLEEILPWQVSNFEELLDCFSTQLHRYTSQQPWRGFPLLQVFPHPASSCLLRRPLCRCEVMSHRAVVHPDSQVSVGSCRGGPGSGKLEQCFVPSLPLGSWQCLVRARCTLWLTALSYRLPLLWLRSLLWLFLRMCLAPT